MADGSFPTLVSADRDANAVGNPIFTQLSDGTADLHKNVDDAAGGTDSGMAMLVVRDDTLSTLTPADGDYTTLRVNSEGALHVTGTFTASEDTIYVDDSAFTVGTDSITGIGALADETSPDSVDEGDIGIPRMTLDRKLLTRIVGSTDANRLEVNSDGSINVNFTEAALTDEIHDYDTAAAVAGDATDNHDYTVANTTFLLKRVVFGASGGMKAEIQTGPLASLVTVAVGFIPRAGGHDRIVFDPPREVPVTSTGTVRVIRTNRQGSAQDVYSTIMGRDIT